MELILGFFEAVKRDESDMLGPITGEEDGLLEWYVDRQGDCMDPSGWLAH